MTYVLLDFDGPIVDLIDAKSGLLLTHTILEVASQFGFTSSEMCESSLFIPVWADVRQAIISAGRDVQSFDQQVHIAIEKHEVSIARSAQAHPCSHEVLATARQFSDGVAIVSNNSAKAISAWLSQHCLVRLVDCVCGRSTEQSFVSLKPSPDLINKALNKFRCWPSDAIFFGDTDSDYLSSRAAGVKFIGMRTRHSTSGRENSHDPTVWLLNSRADLSRHIQATLGQ